MEQPDKGYVVYLNNTIAAPLAPLDAIDSRRGAAKGLSFNSLSQAKSYAKAESSSWQCVWVEDGEGKLLKPYYHRGREYLE